MRTLADVPAATHSELPTTLRGVRAHFIGIGGAGMSGAASLFLQLGADVSGSDLIPFEGLGRLAGAGARIGIGHRAEQLPDDADLVVVSAAIPPDNPELVAARRRGVRVVKYAEAAALLMRRFPCGVAVAGTHGKSTTSAMLAWVLHEGGMDPSFLIGACSDQLGGGSGLGRGPHFVLEACEFDRSFLHLRPGAAAILNIEPDHLDCYRNLDDIVEAFAHFAAQVDEEGVVFVSAADARVRQSVRRASARVETFGLDVGADWRAVRLRQRHGCYSFDVTHGGERIASTRLSIPGRHNVLNSLAAIGLACHGGVPPSEAAQAMREFNGVRRRLMWRGRGRGVTLVDDYAHHPTEIRVTIDAARKRYRPKRMWVVFQPHQHARTRYLMDEFAASFDRADEIVVVDVYGARESAGAADRLPCRSGRQSPVHRNELFPGTERSHDDALFNGSAELVERIRRCGGRAQHVPGLEAVASHVEKRIAAGDLVLTMGAGDVWKVADELVARLCGSDRV